LDVAHAIKYINVTSFWTFSWNGMFDISTNVEIWKMMLGDRHDDQLESITWNNVKEKGSLWCNTSTSISTMLGSVRLKKQTENIGMVVNNGIWWARGCIKDVNYIGKIARVSTMSPSCCWKGSF